MNIPDCFLHGRDDVFQPSHIGRIVRIEYATEQFAAAKGQHRLEAFTGRLAAYAYHHGKTTGSSGTDDEIDRLLDASRATGGFADITVYFETGTVLMLDHRTVARVSVW